MKIENLFYYEKKRREINEVALQIMKNTQKTWITFFVLNLKPDGVFELSPNWFVVWEADCVVCCCCCVCGVDIECVGSVDAVVCATATVVDVVTMLVCRVETCPAGVTVGEEGTTVVTEDGRTGWLLPRLLLSSCDNVASEQLPPLLTRLRLERERRKKKKKKLAT